MNFEEMSKEELIEYIKNINETNNGKYGLLWDKEKEPEKIIEECNKNIPILKEIENKKIENEGENNILIEGDNFHASGMWNRTISAMNEPFLPWNVHTSCSLPSRPVHTLPQSSAAPMCIPRRSADCLQVQNRFLLHPAIH